MTRAELPDKIETKRLVLRVRTVADAEDIFDYASRPEVSYPAGFHLSRPWKMRFIIWSISFLSVIKRKVSQLAMGLSLKEPIKSLVLLTSITVTKMMFLSSAIPYPDYWGRGYVPEAARALIDLGFQELGLHKIELVCLWIQCPKSTSRRETWFPS